MELNFANFPLKNHKNVIDIHNKIYKPFQFLDKSFKVRHLSDEQIKFEKHTYVKIEQNEKRINTYFV